MNYLEKFVIYHKMVVHISSIDKILLIIVSYSRSCEKLLFKNKTKSYQNIPLGLLKICC